MEKTTKYGLMHAESGKMLTVRQSSNHGGDFCCDVQHILEDDEDNPVWLVDEPEHAEYVRLHSTEWYNADYSTPTHRHGYDSAELKVVKYAVIVETEDVDVSIPAYPEYLKMKYTNKRDKAHRDHCLEMWTKLHGTTSQPRYNLYDLYELGLIKGESL